MKRIIVTAIISFSFLSCSEKKNEISSKISWIDFEWSSIELNGKDYEKGAMMVPVSLNSNVTNSFMQLDLGSSISMLYDKPINKLVSDGIIEKFALDTVNIESSKKDNYLMTKELNLKFADAQVNPEGLLIKKDFGKNAILGKKTPEGNKIGTLGVDYFSDKILMIDFKENRISIFDSLSKEVENKIEFEPCKFKGGSPLISLKTGKRRLNVIFDTGSSLFALLTKKEIFEEITNSSHRSDTLSVPSFGNMLTIIGKPLSSDVMFGNIKLGRERAYLVDQNIEQMFNSAGIDGLTGNKLFLSHTIVVDFRNGRFGIKK